MNRGNMRDLLLMWTDDLNGTYFTPAQTNVWLNNAQRVVQNKLIQSNSTYYVTTTQTPTIVNQMDYVLPSDFLTLARLELVISGTGINEVKQRLLPIPLNQQDRTFTAAGLPCYYTFKKDRFTVFPAPDSASYYLRLYYSKVVADMSLDADIPDVPTQFQEWVPVIAALDAFVKDDRVPANLLAKGQMYEKIVIQMSDERNQDESRSVNVTSDEGFGSGYF